MSSSESRLILPGDPAFSWTLGTALPPTQNQDAVFIQRPGSLLLEPVTGRDLDEYLLSGEYDDRMAEIETEEAELAQQEAEMDYWESLEWIASSQT